MWTLLLALFASLTGAPGGAARAQEAPPAPTETTGATAAANAGAANVAAAKPQLREQNCLSPADMREVLESKRVIDPVAAIRAAQAAVPKAEIVRANLCRVDEHYLYLLTALRRDGHFVHVTVNAESGKVAGLW